MNRVLATLREEVDTAEVLGGVLVLGALYALTDFEETALATLGGVVVGVPVVSAVFDALGVGKSAAGVAFGAVVLSAGGLLALEGTPIFGGVVGAIGVWIVLDAVYGWRTGSARSTGEEHHDEPLEDASFGETRRALEDSGVVVRTLRDAPTPLPEADLADRTDLDRARFDAALRMAVDSAAVEETPRGYAARESELGLVALLRRTLRRLARPLRLFVPG